MVLWQFLCTLQFTVQLNEKTDDNLDKLENFIEKKKLLTLKKILYNPYEVT